MNWPPITTALRRSESQLYEALARHILLNLRGMALVQCIRDMTAAGEEVNLSSLRVGLAERNIHIVLIDHTDLDRIRADLTSVVDVFNREAHHAMMLKKLIL